jgi:hypothetical protein
MVLLGKLDAPNKREFFHVLEKVQEWLNVAPIGALGLRFDPQEFNRYEIFLTLIVLNNM